MRISDWSSDVCSSDLDLGNRCPRQYHDLHPERLWRGHLHQAPRLCQLQGLDVADGGAGLFADDRRRRDVDDWPRRQYHDRSEEHTSELQSLMRISYAVICLKKKKKQINTCNHKTTYKQNIK